MSTHTASSQSQLQQVRNIAMNLPYDIMVEILSYRDALPSRRLARYSWQGPWLRSKTILQPALLAPCLVNKNWHVAASSILYQDVFLTSDRALKTFVHTLERREDLRGRVRSVFFSRACSKERDFWAWIGQSVHLDRLESLCPNLQYGKVWARPVDEAGNQNIGALDSGAGPVATEFPGWNELDFTSLTRLELRTMGSVPDSFNTQLFLPMLEDLIIQAWKATPREKEVRSRWPKMPRLRRLCLLHCDISSATLGIDGFFRSDRPQWNLRALDLIGSNAGKELDNLLTSILLTARGKLEMLSYFPSVYGYCFKHYFLNSVFSLRIGIEYLHWISPQYGLPPHLMHLVLVDVNHQVHLKRYQDFFRDMVDLRWSGDAYTRLRTVQVSTQHDENTWAGYKKIAISFKRVGVKFFLTKLGAAFLYMS